MIEIDALKDMAEMCPAQVLKLHEPEFQGAFNGERPVVRKKINSIFPTVKWVRSTRGMELWDTWEIEYFD
jgi:hypothetical protein